MCKRSYKTGRQRKLDIFNVTLDLEYRTGLYGFTIEDIADECGISKATVISYFRGITNLRSLIVKYRKYIG